MGPPTLRPPETFETARLRLRRPRMEDAPAIYARYASDSDVTRYLPWRPHTNVEGTRTFLSRLLRAMDNGSGTCAWIIEGRDDRRLMGLVSLAIQTAREGDLLSTDEEREHYRALIAYHLARSEWGQGYATEAAQAVVDWALAQPRVYRIWTVCDIDNLASVRVLEKLGMRREGILKRWSIHPNISPEPRDAYCYALAK